MIRFGPLPVSQAEGILTLEVISLSPNHILTLNDVAITKTRVWRRNRPLSAGFTQVDYFSRKRERNFCKLDAQVITKTPLTLGWNRSAPLFFEAVWRVEKNPGGSCGALNYKTMVWWKKSRPGPGGIPRTAYRALSEEC